jgi:hypothetical protein
MLSDQQYETLRAEAADIAAQDRAEADRKANARVQISRDLAMRILIKLRRVAGREFDDLSRAMKGHR